MEVEFKGVLDKIILVKLTTRQRPQQAARVLNAAKELAHNPSRIKYMVTLDADDETYGETSKLISALDISCMFYAGGSRSKIHAINRDVDTFSKLEHWDILVNLSDDQTCIMPGWDAIIREAMPNDLDASLWFYDGAQPRINTMEIVGKNYYNRTGTIYNKEYKSFYCDEEATNVAQLLGKMIKSPTILFRHDHPACHHTTSLRHDNLYERNQSHWDEDKVTFQRRKGINYGL